jgi:hypothetical protein
MKAYILRKKNQPEYSHENFIILANDKRELNRIAKENPSIVDLRNFEIEERNAPGLIYTDIY